MKTTHYFFLIAFIIIFVSCKSEESSELDTESYLTIKGITSLNEFGELTGNIDHDDWILNDKFTTKEKLLFDTLNFTKTATVEPISNTENSMYIQPQILFFPNPYSTIGRLYYYHDKHILNIIIVDKRYKKLLTHRVENTTQISFNLSNLSKGIYRLYYVIQDSGYNIVHFGHGDIEKE